MNWKFVEIYDPQSYPESAWPYILDAHFFAGNKYTINRISK